MLSGKTISALGLLLCLAPSSFARTPSDVSIEVPQPIPQLPRFVYLRCNATGWDVNATTRMKRVPHQPQLLSLTYEVKEDWMVAAADDCSLTATPAKDGWGDRQVYFGVQNGFVNVPNGSVNLTFNSSADVYFKVKYPAKGRYTAYLSLSDYPFFAVVPHVDSGH